MTDAPERIWVELPNLFDDMGFWMASVRPDLIEYIRADLSPLGAVVKPLLWEPWHLGISEANTAWGLYRTWEGHWRAPDMAWGRPSTDPHAAAQADYAARILAALLPPTHAAQLAAALELPEVAALRDAANQARLAIAGLVSVASAERKLDDALAALEAKP